jgi:hypothetical protein
MAEDSYELLAYWRNRPETAQACAQRFAQMANGLARIDPVFGRWTQQTKAPFRAMPTDLGELTRIFDQNRCYKDRPRELWPEMGFSLGAWNGLENPYGQALGLRAGAFRADADRIAANHAFLNLSKRRIRTERPWTGGELQPVLECMVEAWGAQYAVVCGQRFDPFIPRTQNGHYRWPWAAWMTYLTPPSSLLVVPPEGTIVTRYANGGLLVTLCDEPFDVDNHQHMAAAEAMQKALRPVQW